MGFFDMFKKELVCGRCTQQVDKGQLCFCEFEAPLVGQEKQQWLCRSCLATSFRECMENYKGRIVAVWPMKEYDGYHLYQLEKMPGMEYSRSFIAAIQRKLPVDQVCGDCGRAAKVSCFSSDLVKGNPVDFAMDHWGREKENRVDETCRGEYFCADCFAKAVVQKMSEAGWPVGQMVIPSQGDAFFTPMEAS